MTICPERENTLEELDFPSPTLAPLCYKTMTPADECTCKGCAGLALRQQEIHYAWVRMAERRYEEPFCYCSPRRDQVWNLRGPREEVIETWGDPTPRTILT